MDNRDDKKNIHVNPDFISKRDEAQVKSKVHVNPAFFQKTRSPHEISVQAIHSHGLSRSFNNPLQNKPPSKVQSPPSAPITLQSQLSQNQTSSLTGGQVQSRSDNFTSKNFTNNVPAVSYRPLSMVVDQSRVSNPASSFSSVYSERGIATLQSQAYHASTTKPSTYSWRTANSYLPDYSYVATTVSNVPRGDDEWSNTVGSLSSSRFRYQSQDVSKDMYLKSGVNVSKSHGNKFKVDNRTSVQGLDRKPDQIKYGYEKHCNTEGSHINARTTFSSKVLNLTNSGKTLSLEMAKGTNSNLKEILKERHRKQDKTVLHGEVNSNRYCKNFSSNSVSSSNCTDAIKTHSKTTDDNQKSVIAIEKSSVPAPPPPAAEKSVPYLATEKVNPINSGKNSSGSLVAKSSNILINPVLLKSLSSNDKIDIVAIASKSCLHKSDSCIVPENSKVLKQKVKGGSNNVFKDFSSLTPKYKLLSKTKLVRHRSRSFSKGKPKAVHVKERQQPFGERLPVQSQSLKREGSAVTLCRPSSVFPTRLHSSLTKVHPRRRSVVISRTKLIRRLSGSSNTMEDLQGKQSYSIKTKTKLVKKQSSSTLKSPRLAQKLEVLAVKPDVQCRSKYALISKTKLIRRKSNSGILKTRGQREINSPDIGTIIRRHKLVRNAPLKPGKMLLSKNSDVKQFRRVNTKYKIENRGCGLSAKQKAAKGIVSKYRINRLKVESPTVKQIISRRRFTWISSKRKCQHSQLSVRRRGSAKFSDRIVNIGGILYKSTKTSLRKQMAKKKHIHEGGKGSKCIVKLHGNQYHVSAGGRTLTRTTREAASSSGPSLSRVHIGGLTYSRTKTGHYELTKVHQARAVLSFAKQRSMNTLSLGKKRGLLQKRNQHCIFFNRFGRCTKKDKGECPYLHDPKRIAICTRFLRGRCPVSNCPFSHEVDPDKMPVCSHFVRSTCTRENCPYRHVRVNPNAPLCLDFLHGHCPLGQECKKQHVLECEEFSTSGKCPRGEGCPLSHRKASRKKRKSVSLEPAVYHTQKGVKSFHLRRQKSSDDTLDVLGGPKIKKKVKRHVKSWDSLHQRYFQVSDDNDILVKNNVHTAGVDSKEISGVNETNSILDMSLTNVSCDPNEEKELFRNEKNREKIFLGSSDIEQKRVCVLQKVENMKQNYDSNSKGDLVKSGIHSNNEKIDEYKSDKGTEIDVTKEIGSESSDFKCDAFERRPLPKKMPSYISLVKETCDVEDL